MSRKYRQRGYREDEGGERREKDGSKRCPGGADRPKGRGLGKPEREVFRCAVCGREEDPPAPEETEASCGGCGNPLHTCTNCRHFDSGARFRCRQPIEEPVRPKGKANACTFYEARISVSHAKEESGPPQGRDAFDALFDDL